MIRYYITKGSRTTNNGTVITADPTTTINGVEIATEGDHVQCPKCKSIGRIICTGPRIPEYIYGKNVALEGDFCACKCSPFPRLIASQNLRCQNIEGASIEEKSPPVKFFNLHFKIISEITGKPMCNTGYKITLEDETEVKGHTDENGLTEKVSSSYAALATITAPYYDDYSTGETESNHECDTCHRDDSREGNKWSILGKSFSGFNFTR